MCPRSIPRLSSCATHHTISKNSNQEPSITANRKRDLLHMCLGPGDDAGILEARNSCRKRPRSTPSSSITSRSNDSVSSPGRPSSSAEIDAHSSSTAATTHSTRTTASTAAPSPKPKQVSFSDKVHAIIGSSDASASSSPPEDWSDVWYQKSELAVFVQQAREHVLRQLGASSSVSGSGHRTTVTCPSGPPTTSSTPGASSRGDDDTDDSTQQTTARGYERYDIGRARQKNLARRITLMACATKGLSEDDVAVIAHRCSSRAEEQAFWTGFSDYCAVYCPHAAPKLLSLGGDR